MKIRVRIENSVSLTVCGIWGAMWRTYATKPYSQCGRQFSLADAFMGRFAEVVLDQECSELAGQPDMQSFQGASFEASRYNHLNAGSASSLVLPMNILAETRSFARR